jgi:hypothetical protein
MTAQDCSKDMWICLWLYLPFSDLVMGSAKRSTPTLKLSHQKGPLYALLPPVHPIRELFDELFKNPFFLFALDDNLSGEQIQPAVIEPEAVKGNDDGHPTDADLRYYFFFIK